MKNRTITALINERHAYASILYYFGIEFYNCPEKTLEEVCKEKDLYIESVLYQLEKAGTYRPTDLKQFEGFTINLLIEYLKHTHHVFIKKRLPFISKLLTHVNPINDNFEKDLKFVFPIFIEDFIGHIYEEEDTLFRYINNMEKFLNKNQNASCIFYEMDKYSIKKLAFEHNHQEDEMAGLRAITDNFNTDLIDNIFLKVIFSELKMLDQELKIHAKIENEILFPKAIALEQRARKCLKEMALFN